MSEPIPEPLEKKPHLGKQLWTQLQPHVDWAWVCVRVWFPWLAPPALRKRQVTYPSRPYLNDATWRATLPKQCITCGKTDALQPQGLERSIRDAESPAAIVAASVGAFAFFLLLSIYFLSPTCLMLALLSPAINIAIIVKSVVEDVELTYYCCAEHAATAQAPDLVANDQQLCVIMPHAGLADAAREQIRAERAARKAGGPAALQRSTREEVPRPAPKRQPPLGSIPLDGGADAGANPAPQGDTPPSARAPRAPLPPIKLDE
jgi:hypothetical protein